MNENPISTGSEDLKETCASLRHQLNSVLILLLVVSATLTIFFSRQVAMTRKDLTQVRTAIIDYKTNAIPALQQFTLKLQEYAKTHPDVMPILVKYGVPQATPPSAPAPAPASTPKR